MRTGGRVRAGTAGAVFCLNLLKQTGQQDNAASPQNSVD
jgi:hypothetical protein